jgi:hypothetical protein
MLSSWQGCSHAVATGYTGQKAGSCLLVPGRSLGAVSDTLSAGCVYQSVYLSPAIADTLHVQPVFLGVSTLRAFSGSQAVQLPPPSNCRAASSLSQKTASSQ